MNIYIYYLSLVRINNFKNYKNIRIEYDAYRSDLEMLAQMPRTDSNTVRVDDAQQNYQRHKEEFEKLRSDVIVKLKFLDENRVSTNKIKTDTKFICIIGF